MSDVAILVVALGFAAMGLVALVRPAEILSQFGVTVETPDGRNEISAVYGGFGLAIAVLLAVAAIGEPATADGIVVAVAIATLGMAAGRLLSAVRERPSGLYPVWTYFAIEIVIAAVLLLAV